jgi:phage-related protein
VGRIDRADLKSFPDAVQDAMGYAPYIAQLGGKPLDAKPLRGLGAGVLEVVTNHDGSAFRSVYTIRFARAVYVLHAFQKKSRRSVVTPKHEIDVVVARLRSARAHYVAKCGEDLKNG